jgi:hypothetical protein
MGYAVTADVAWRWMGKKMITDNNYSRIYKEFNGIKIRKVFTGLWIADWWFAVLASFTNCIKLCCWELSTCVREAQNLCDFPQPFPSISLLIKRS